MKMEFKIESKKGGFPILWCGLSRSPFLWFDIDYWFSVDLGKWYIRLFFEFNDFNFCRYLGVIK